MWMMAIAAVMQVVGSVMKGVSEMQTNKANAEFAKAEGKSALASAKAEAARQKTIDDAQLGEMRATVGAQGSTFEGSPMTVYLDSLRNASLKEQDIIYGGQVKKVGKDWEAKMYRRQASAALFQGIWGGVSSAMSSMGSMGGGGAAGGASSAGSSMSSMSFSSGSSGAGSSLLTR